MCDYLRYTFGLKCTSEIAVACGRRCSATLSIVVPPRQQSQCTRAVMPSIVTLPSALFDAVAPSRLALSRCRVRNRCAVAALTRSTPHLRSRQDTTHDHNAYSRDLSHPRPFQTYRGVRFTRFQIYLTFDVSAIHKLKMLSV